MTKRMLIDSTHAEETRVVVLDGNRLDEYDVEASSKRQLKGNIYLAKVVRVEPSLQAAFVEYGGNRHGFLAFGEIHPDYYQIPVADRQRLIELQEAEAREEEEAEDRDAAAQAAAPLAMVAEPRDAPASEAMENEGAPDTALAEDAIYPHPVGSDEPERPGTNLDEATPAEMAPTPLEMTVVSPDGELTLDETAPSTPAAATVMDTVPAEGDAPTQLGGELETEYQRPERAAPKFTRHYQIQEVIRRRQILLIQVVKEERGSKGAALTTYISLAGRFSVLMPNSPRGGGISRKITSAADRRRLKEVTAELDLPRGMGLIIRTAGANRPKPEIMRDCEYLLNQWDEIRDLTMKSVAPALIYEEASLIKRAIRDVYSRDVEDILVDGEEGWRAARDFMRMLMPTHAKKVQLWKDPQPLFAKAQVESQLDAMLLPTVQLKSGGYLVINQTEALVAIDVNSGRSTRERSIEDTALRTNLEAADEAARQLRLRDLAGLIVIDFIDMESRRNNAAVEKRLKDALKLDRARIQLGSISHFGLLEMSRQRLRPSLAETSFVMCTHCSGTGTVRSTESAALHVLRAIEEEGGKKRSAEVIVHVAGAIALYILNHKRQRLAEVEQRYGMVVVFAADETLLAPNTRIVGVRAHINSDGPAPVSQLAPPEPFEDEDELTEATEAEAEAGAEAGAGAEDESDEAPPGETAEEGEQRTRRRRRRRGGRREESDSGPVAVVTETAGRDMLAEGSDETAAPEDVATETVSEDTTETAAEEGERKRRGRRGGRRRRREPGDTAPGSETGSEAGPEASSEARSEPGDDGDQLQPRAGTEPAYVPQRSAAPAPAYSGPTPANPFGGASAYDIFDAIEQAEQERALALTAARAAIMTPAVDMVAAPELEPPRLEPPKLEPLELEQPELELPEHAMPEPAEPEHAEPEPAKPEPTKPESVAAPVTAAPQPVVNPAPVVSLQPVVMTEPVVAEPEPEPSQPAASVSAPVLNSPVMIPSGEPVAAPRKGWWRR